MDDKKKAEAGQTVTAEQVALNLKLEVYARLVDHAIKSGVLEFEGFGVKFKMHPSQIEAAIAERHLAAVDTPMAQPPPPAPEEEKDWLQMIGRE